MLKLSMYHRGKNLYGMYSSNILYEYSTLYCAVAVSRLGTFECKQVKTDVFDRLHTAI